MKYFKIKNLVLIIIFLFVGYYKVCSQHAKNENYLLLKVENFQKKVNDKNVSLYFLKNGNISMAITNYGARIVSLCVPDKNGEIADIVIGFKSIDEYMNFRNTQFCVGNNGTPIMGSAYSEELNILVIM